MSSTERPPYISPSWIRCTQGKAFALKPPESLSTRSGNPWERTAAVYVQALQGHFEEVPLLLEVARSAADWHLRDCAIDLYAATASSGQVPVLATLFKHADHDTRLEAYQAVRITGSVALALQLARHRSEVQGSERDSVMDSVSHVLEPSTEEMELSESPLDEAAYVQRAEEIAAGLPAGVPSIFLGEPLSARGFTDRVVALCSEEDPGLHGGDIDTMLRILENLTGAPYVGCLDDDCAPVMPRLSSFINTLRQSGSLDSLAPGKRYFNRLPLT